MMMMQILNYLCLFGLLLTIVTTEDSLVKDSSNDIPVESRDDVPSVGASIKTLTSCKGQLSDGSYIDLTSLNNPSTPRMVTAGDFMYRFNPCGAISCGKESDSGVCQTFKNDQSYTFDLGDQKSQVFSIDTLDTVSLNFKAGDRTTQIQCICGQLESFTFVKEDPKKTYYFIFVSPCCCPNGCSATPTITTLTPCTARLNTGKMIDLSSLNNPSSPRVIQALNYKYTFNPCDPVPCNTFDTAGICQQDLLLRQYYNLGNQNSVVFSLDNDNNPILNFQSSTRTSSIQCLCGQVESFQFVRENPIRNYSFVFISPCCCPDGCANTDIVTLSPCKARLGDGSLIDLTALSNPSKPRTFTANGYTYAFNPCDPIQCTPTSNNTATCQSALSVNLTYNLGDQNSAKFVLNDKQISIQFTATNDPYVIRKSNIACICSPTEDFRFVDEKPARIYNMEFRSPCCCPNAACKKSDKLNEEHHDENVEESLTN